MASNNDSMSEKFFSGIVNSSDPATYLVNVGPTDKNLNTIQNIAGIALSTCFANLFGFKECTVIQPGAKVFCYLVRTDFCYVLGVIPNTDIDLEDYPARSSMGAGDSANDQANLQGYQKHMNKTVLTNNRRPTDVVDGEHVIANDYGVMLGLLQMMAQLKGSELAQVQCFLLDDLVRIISHNFQHYTAMGEFKVFHDGKSLHAEFGATSSPTEAGGIAEPVFSSNTSVFTEVDGSSKDDSTDFYGITGKERTVAIERFKLFLGKLGDFLNLFIVRPVEGAIRDVDGTVPTTFDTGLLQQRMSTDGGYYLRSVKEIFMEKTNWIRVPQRIRTPEDPNGDSGTDLTFPEKELYEADITYQYKGNPFLAYLQLRNYVAYINENVGYKNFVTQEKDMAVSDSPSKEVNLNTIDNIDPQTPAQMDRYALRTSGVYLMENGGVCIRDAWGSALVLEGGDIFVQPAKDLVMQPLRNFIAKVGQFTSFAGNQDIDFSSTSKGVRFKADQAVYLYSANSGVVLQADGTTLSPGPADPTQVVETVSGVVLKSKLGIYNFAETGIANITKTDFLVKADNTVRIDSKQVTQVSSDNELILAGNQAASLISASYASVISNGACILGGAASTSIGQKGEYLGLGYQEKDPFVDPIKGILDINSLYQPFAQAVLKGNDLLYVASPFTTTTSVTNLSFKFLKSSTYGVNNQTDPIPMTMAQQEDQTSNLYGLVNWTENAVNNTMPYPGQDNFSGVYASTSGAIPNLQVFEGQDYTGKANSTNQPMRISAATLNNYKVQPLV